MTLNSVTDDGHDAIASWVFQVIGHFGADSVIAGDYHVSGRAPPSAAGAPPAPSDLEIEAPEAGTLVLSWLRSKGAQTYQVWRKETSETQFHIVTNHQPSGDDAHKKRVTWTDTTVVAGHTYWYDIVALHGHLSSAPSNTEHATAL